MQATQAPPPSRETPAAAARPRREQYAPIIAREGWPIVAIFVVGWLLLSNAAWYVGGPIAGWTV